MPSSGAGTMAVAQTAESLGSGRDTLADPHNLTILKPFHGSREQRRIISSTKALTDAWPGLAELQNKAAWEQIFKPLRTVLLCKAVHLPQHIVKPNTTL